MGKFKEAKLSVSGHMLMENRHGLCVELRLEPATGTAEREAAEQMLARPACKGLHPTELGFQHLDREVPSKNSPKIEQPSC